MSTYRKNFFILSSFAALLAPSIAFGQGFKLASSNFKGIICYIVSLLYIVIPILVGLALLLFFWGLSKFIINSSGNEKELQTGKNYMIWGIAALFVLLSFRAIISVVTGTLGFKDANSFPFLPSNNTSVCSAAELELTPDVHSTITPGPGIEG